MTSITPALGTTTAPAGCGPEAMGIASKTGAATVVTRPRSFTPQYDAAHTGLVRKAEPLAGRSTPNGPLNRQRSGTDPAIQATRRTARTVPYWGRVVMAKTVVFDPSPYADHGYTQTRRGAGAPGRCE